MKAARNNGRAGNGAPRKIRPGDVEAGMSHNDFPRLSKQSHVERNPSRILKIGLVILGGGIGLTLGPLYVFSKDFGIPEMIHQQDLTGVYLLSAYLLIIAILSLWRFGNRKHRDWLDREI